MACISVSSGRVTRGLAASRCRSSRAAGLARSTPSSTATATSVWRVDRGARRVSVFTGWGGGRLLDGWSAPPEGLRGVLRLPEPREPLGIDPVNVDRVPNSLVRLFHREPVHAAWCETECGAVHLDGMQSVDTQGRLARHRLVTDAPLSGVASVGRVVDLLDVVGAEPCAQASLVLAPVDSVNEVSRAVGGTTRPDIEEHEVVGVASQHLGRPRCEQDQTEPGPNAAEGPPGVDPSAPHPQHDEGKGWQEEADAALMLACAHHDHQENRIGEQANIDPHAGRAGKAPRQGDAS